MEVSYDRAVDAIKEAEDEVKSYATRIKKLGGKFDLADGDIRYRKKGGKRYHHAAGVTAAISKYGGKVSVVANAQKAAVTVKHEFIHFMGDVAPGFREHLYQAFADRFADDFDFLDMQVSKAYAKYEKLFGPFSEKNRVDYYEEFFADVNAGLNELDLDEGILNDYHKLIQDIVETHEQIMLDVRAKERAARKAAREKAKGKDGKAKGKGKDGKFWLTSDLSWEELLPYVFARSEATEDKPHGKSIYSVGMTVLPNAPRLSRQTRRTSIRICCPPLIGMNLTAAMMCPTASWRSCPSCYRNLFCWCAASITG